MDDTREAADDTGETTGEVHRHLRRKKALAAIAVGALAAGVVWVVIEAAQSARNPCRRAMSAKNALSMSFSAIRSCLMSRLAATA